MAVLNPTSYTQYIDESLLEGAKPILEASVAEIVSDQIFALDQTTMVLSWAGFPITFATGPAYSTYANFYVRNRDMCDVDSVSNDEIPCDFYIRGWATDGSTAGAVQLVSTATGTTTATATIPAGTTTATWIKAAASFDVKTNAIEDTLTLKAARSAGSGSLYCASLLVIALET